MAHFADRLTSDEGMPPRAIADDAVQRLADYDWPGNVRELRNTVERLLILSPGPRVTAADVERLVGNRAAEQTSLGSLVECRTFEEFKQAAERAFLLAKLRESNWNVSETARLLDMPRSNLYKKIERYGLVREIEPERGSTMSRTGIGTRSSRRSTSSSSRSPTSSCFRRSAAKTAVAAAGDRREAVTHLDARRPGAADARRRARRRR